MKLDRKKVQQKLLDAGVPGEQATSHAEVYGELQNELATKADLEETERVLKADLKETNSRIDKVVQAVIDLKDEMRMTETRLVKWMVAMNITTASLVVAILRLFPG